MFALLFPLLDDLWDPGSCRSVSLGSEPVRTLLVLDDSVWASCGNAVTAIDVSSLRTQVSDHGGGAALHFAEVLQPSEIAESLDQQSSDPIHGLNIKRQNTEVQGKCQTFKKDKNTVFSKPVLFSCILFFNKC